MKSIKQVYNKVLNYIKNKLLKIIIVCSILFIICMISGIFFGIKYQSETQQILKSFIENKSDIISDSGNISAFGIIKNNVVACIVSIIIGFFPFIFLPILTLSLNGFVLGITLGIGKSLQNMSMIKILLLGILPHGIFEIPAIIISIAIGLNLCLCITKKIIGKYNEKIIDDIKESILVFACIIIPLLIVAGIVEAYITPTLLK